jgi:methyltransferase (TIGR00027 family)
MSDIRNISDTAQWVAMYRAIETERPDALFKDPFARRLGGERGQQIYDSVPKRSSPDWAYAMRTYLTDRYVLQEVGSGVDMVINLAAGLDTRPYRMELPSTLQWIEVDLPEMIDYKERMLADAKPVCKLERVRLDLADSAARNKLFAQLASRAKKVMIVSEGLLVYLTREQVEQLAEDLAKVPTIRRWVTDLANPVILKMIQKNMGKRLAEAGAPLHFGPVEGPKFFESHGWRVISFEPYLHHAARLRRVNFIFRFFAKISDPKKYVANRPWSAAVLLGKD